jgi:hypothetical protein
MPCRRIQEAVPQCPGLRPRAGDRRPAAAQQQQRVRWWSALALLRSLASSPAAAAATLRTRSGTAEAEKRPRKPTIVGERSVLDLDDTDASEFLDVAPGGQEGRRGQPAASASGCCALPAGRGLFGPQQDAKLATAMEVVKKLLKDGYNPILFCRFIPTAEYVAEELRRALPNKVEVWPSPARCRRPSASSGWRRWAEHEQRVLVATDCLSEGINLQEHFDAVMHYDLSWNPTRHEQREGRVDRYGQPEPRRCAPSPITAPTTRSTALCWTCCCASIRPSAPRLGISVPVPANGPGGPGPDAGAAAARLAREWQAMREAIGSGIDVERFTRMAITAHGGFVEQKDGALELHLPNKASFREAVTGVGNNDVDVVKARFEMPVPDGVVYLSRTHPFVEGLAGYVMDAALDPLLDEEAKARRCGAIRTRKVEQLTTLLLLRFRFHIERQSGEKNDSCPCWPRRRWWRASPGCRLRRCGWPGMWPMGCFR